METQENKTVCKSGAQSDRRPPAPTKRESVRPADNRSKINPRIVYADPDSFFNRMFHDLLMEQSEQG